MNQRLIHCDGSDFAFSLVQDGRQWVAVPYFRGESLSVEFRESSPELVKIAIAEWVARLAINARSQQ